MKLDKEHLPVLDGWRGISILLVLGAHLLPLGPSRFQLNGTAGQAGMAIFFTLSGFLITHILLKNSDVRRFFIRRLARIIPLVYLYTAIALSVAGASASTWASHLLFFSNLNFTLSDTTAHLWSLCVEMHFYLATGLLVLIGGRRSLYVMPLALFVMLGIRTFNGGYGTIETHRRIDEIISGACLALVFSSAMGQRVLSASSRVPLPFYIIGMLLTCHPSTGGIAHAFRGTAASLMVGATLVPGLGLVSSKLSHPVLKYIAIISYSLYVWHPLIFHGWLSGGDKLFMYLVKRPAGFVILWIVSHLSTFYYERFFSNLSQKITQTQPRSPANALST